MDSYVNLCLFTQFLIIDLGVFTNLFKIVSTTCFIHHILCIYIALSCQKKNDLACLKVKVVQTELPVCEFVCFPFEVVSKGAVACNHIRDTTPWFLHDL